MKQNYIKFLIGLLCMVWLFAFAVPTTAHAEESEDTRTHIDRVDISTNIDEVLGYGKENNHDHLYHFPRRLLRGHQLNI